MKYVPLLVLLVMGTSAAFSPARAQTAPPTAAAPAGDKSVSLPDTSKAPLPASARRALPRGAETLFCVSARIEGRPVVLHGWNPARKGDTTVDILSSPGGTASRTARRLQRIRMERIDPNSIGVSTAPLDAKTKRGVVIVLDYSVKQASFSSSIVPLKVITLPSGIGGRVVVNDFSTETEPGGGAYYQPLISEKGSFFLRLKEYVTNDLTARYTPFTWDGKGYKKGKTGPEQPNND